MITIEYPTFPGVSLVNHEVSMVSTGKLHGFHRICSRFLIADPKDPTLWCISAWNENSPAPFAADLTGLSRAGSHRFQHLEDHPTVVVVLVSVSQSPVRIGLSYPMTDPDSYAKKMVCH